MKKFTLPAVFVLAATVSAPNFASDQRISQLENEVRDLKNRISRLESNQVQTPNPSATNRNTGGWKQLSNWRILKRGMSYDEIRSIFGEPERITGGTVTRWFYGDTGVVVFYNHKLDSWTEPRSR